MVECYFYTYGLVQMFPKSKKRYEMSLKSLQKMYLFEVNLIPIGWNTTELL